MEIQHTVLVTGGAGYVGSALIPKLLRDGYRVRVLDLFLFGDDFFAPHPNLSLIRGDLRDQELLAKILPGCDSVIHLACISNDPSFELDPDLGKAINYDAFTPLVQIAKASGVNRFIYASSSSVYGIKEELNVSEDLALEPLTDYSKYKALCEDILLREQRPGFEVLILRPATVCGYAPRLRLDVCVNLLTSQAYTNRKITVFGGSQLRPNIHVEDMTDLYLLTLRLPRELIDGRVFNAGYQNLSIADIASLIQKETGEDVTTTVTPTDDNRSYHISSEKIGRELDFHPNHTVQMAIHDLIDAFNTGKVPNMMTDPRYYNIRTLQNAALT